MHLCWRGGLRRRGNRSNQIMRNNICERAAETPSRLPEIPRSKRGSPCTRNPSARTGSRLGLLFHLVDVAVFDLAHQVMTMKKIILQMRGQLARHDAELVANHF